MVSAPHDHEVQFMVKINPSKRTFTGKLMSNLNHLVGMTAMIDGPYGNPSIHQRHYENFVHFVNGVGASASLSILKDKLAIAAVQKASQEKMEEYETGMDDATNRDSIIEPNSPLIDVNENHRERLENGETGLDSEKETINLSTINPTIPPIPKPEGLTVDTGVSKFDEEAGRAAVGKPPMSPDHDSPQSMINRNQSGKKHHTKLKKMFAENQRKQRIVFVWCVKHPLVFMNFKDILLAAAEEYPFLKVELELYCENQKKTYKGIEFMDKELLELVNFGMTPNYPKILRDYMEKIPKTKNIGVYSFGDTDTVMTAQCACKDCNPIIFPRIHFHGQIFDD